MTSKLVVNTIEADTGISSVSFASSISMSSTSKFHFSNAGIDIGADTNINRPAAGVLGFNINNTEKLRIDSNGHLNTTGIATASNFKTGSSNLHSTGLTVGNNFLHTTGINVGTGATIHVPATNVLTFGTNSNERLRINSDGDIGINVSSPQVTKGIQISKGGGSGGVPNTYSVANEYFHLGAAEYNGTDGGSGLFSIGFGYIDGAVNSPAYIGFKETSTGSSTKGDLVFATRSGTADAAPAERVRVKSTGAIDIQSGAYITGSIAINASTPRLTNGLQISKTGGNGGVSDTYNVANEYFHLGAGEYNSSGGLFAIGFGYINNATYSPAYIGFKETNTSSSTKGDLVFATRSGTADAAPDERLRISSTGYVGVGTLGNTSPTAPLSVDLGHAAHDGNYFLDVKGSATKQFGLYYDQGSWGSAEFGIHEFDNSSNAYRRFTIANGGKIGVGIQTNPQGALDIRTTDDDDAIRLVNTSTGNNGIQWWNEYGGLTKRASMDYGEGDANFDIKLFRADAQDDRPYGNVRIFTGSYSSPNMNFRVTTLGTVHQPNQPAFLVRDSVSSNAFGGNTYANFDTVILNRGNHYDTSNGRFTAPIAGTYLFISLMLSNGSNRLFHEIRKNGSQVAGTRTESGTNAGQYQSNTTQAILDLAKGDWVAIHVGSGGAYGGSYSNFSGYLLG